MYTSILLEDYSDPIRKSVIDDRGLSVQNIAKSLSNIIIDKTPIKKIVDSIFSLLESIKGNKKYFFIGTGITLTVMITLAFIVKSQIQRKAKQIEEQNKVVKDLLTQTYDQFTPVSISSLLNQLASLGISPEDKESTIIRKLERAKDRGKLTTEQNVKLLLVLSNYKSVLQYASNEPPVKKLERLIKRTDSLKKLQSSLKIALFVVFVSAIFTYLLTFLPQKVKTKIYEKLPNEPEETETEPTSEEIPDLGESFTLTEEVTSSKISKYIDNVFAFIKFLAKHMLSLGKNLLNFVFSSTVNFIFSAISCA
ncbi:MAG: hypothetical protein QXI16_05610, partial [Sulfolobaceae archaeon]